MHTHKQRTKTASRLAALGIAGALALGAAAPAAQASTDAAAAWPTRYQSWSQVPGNRAGAVFRPYGDKFETWEHRDGYGSTLHWNYKGVADGWHSIRLQDGAAHTYNLDLDEGRRVYFIVQTDAHTSPSYVSEYRISGR
jgi:hypothetical protein